MKQRELKFRAFLEIGDKSEIKVMIDGIAIYGEGRTVGISDDDFGNIIKEQTGWEWDGESFQKGDEIIDGQEWNVNPGDDWVFFEGHVMQFTGLHDKEGKEIYEGDILQFFDKIVACVVWQDFGGWSYKWIDLTYIRIRQQNPEPFFRNIDLFEVIGNVYANPELLK